MHIRNTINNIIQNFKINFTIYIFIFICLFIRLIYWLYTDRVFEDSLITSTAAENFINGYGLTHHISEPRVHSFTSPLSVIIPIVCSPFFTSLTAMRLFSLLAAAGTIIFAHKICKFLNFNIISSIFVLSFLSVDYLHIFYGMAGMETQIAVFSLLAAIYCTLSLKEINSYKDYIWLSATLALCMLSRPDFILPCILLGIWLVIFHSKYAIKIVLLSIMFYSPWLVFTIFYYGSPIPHTILAKSTFFHTNTNIINIIKYICYTLHQYAPFFEFYFAKFQLIYYIIAYIIITIEIYLIFFAICTIVKYKYISIKYFYFFIIISFIYIIYNAIFIHHLYFAWYIPPYTSIFAIIVAFGLNNLYKFNKLLSAILCAVIILSYAFPLPFMFQLDREYQQAIENTVFKKVGETLNSVMKDDDTVVFEPLGYFGYYARNKTTYDMPGLGSKIAYNILKEHKEYPSSLAALIFQANPTFVVLRDEELNDLGALKSEFLKNYYIIKYIKQQKYIFTKFIFNYDLYGNHSFIIFKHK